MSNLPEIKVNDDELVIDLREVLRILRKWSRLIISMTLICTLGAGLVSFFILSPVYESNTLLMVTQATDKLQNPAANQKAEGLDQVVSSVSRIPVMTMNTYLGQLKSEALMKRVAASLSLDANKYNPQVLSGMISGTVVKDTNLIEVKVTNTNPVLASRIANALSSEYLAFMTDKNKEQMSRSVAFLDEQKKINDQDLTIATENLAGFLSQPRGVEVLEAEFKGKTEDRASLSSKLSAATVEMSKLASGVQSLEKELSQIPATVSSEKWNSATGSKETFREPNPLYLGISEQLAEKQASLAEKQGEYATLQLLLTNLNVELDSLQGELAIKRLDQAALQNEADRLKKTSQTLAEKATETQIARSIDLGDTAVMVLSEASVPTQPVKPNKKVNMALAFIIGLILFTLLAFILEHLDNTLKSPEDVERELNLPVLGVVPLMNKNNTGDTA